MLGFCLLWIDWLKFMEVPGRAIERGGLLPGPIVCEKLVTGGLVVPCVCREEAMPLLGFWKQYVSGSYGYLLLSRPTTVAKFAMDVPLMADRGRVACVTAGIAEGIDVLLDAGNSIALSAKVFRFASGWGTEESGRLATGTMARGTMGQNTLPM